MSQTDAMVGIHPQHEACGEEVYSSCDNSCRHDDLEENKMAACEECQIDYDRKYYSMTVSMTRFSTARRLDVK